MQNTPSLLPFEWANELTDAMRQVLEGMLQAGDPPINTLSAVQVRAFYEQSSQALELAPPDILRVEEKTFVARDGAVLPARLYANSPETASLQPAILYWHGGGFVFGSIDTHDTVCRVLAERTGVCVVSFGYRMGPEHRFPTAFNDAEDAMLWLAQNGAQWGIDADRLAVAGDSAGGGLAAASAVLAAQHGIALKAQALVYPSISAFNETASRQKYGQVPVLTQAMLEWFTQNFIDPAQSSDWRADLLSVDLPQDARKVFAPAIFIQAQCDALVDEGLAYADKLRTEGGSVEVVVYQGVTHAFIQLGKVLPEALQALTAMSAFLKNKL